ncbi:MAG: single-stranded DNA-binding protein [Bacilli bacterium]|nr:single-stranded DNA-binding protein [Bacilli bacterium]
MLNKVILIGRTTKDVDLRKTSSGTAVATFTLAVDNRFVQKDGQNTADFISCVAWNNTAEFMNNYVKKGSLVAVEGRIQTRNYDNKDGNRVYVTEVVVETLKSLGSGSRNAERTGSNYDGYEPTVSTSTDYDTSVDVSYDISDDDLPF